MKNNQLTSRKRLPSLLLISMMLTLLALLPSIGARALVVLTVTLAPTTTPTPSPTPMPILLDETLLQDNSLITHDPCAAPCWNGITPGETSWNDALEIIEADTRLEAPTLNEAIDSEAILAEWRMVGGGGCCEMITLDREVVNVIFLRLAPSNLTVGELIEVHGEPTYLTGNPAFENEAVVNLIYPERLMVVYAFVAGAASGEISASSEVIGVVYFAPGAMDELLETSSLNEWEGYETYAYYEQSEPEITPVVTPMPSS